MTRCLIAWRILRDCHVATAITGEAVENRAAFIDQPHVCHCWREPDLGKPSDRPRERAAIVSQHRLSLGTAAAGDDEGGVPSGNLQVLQRVFVTADIKIDM